MEWTGLLSSTLTAWCHVFWDFDFYEGGTKEQENQLLSKLEGMTLWAKTPGGRIPAYGIDFWWDGEDNRMEGCLSLEDREIDVICLPGGHNPPYYLEGYHRAVHVSDEEFWPDGVPY